MSKTPGLYLSAHNCLADEKRFALPLGFQWTKTCLGVGCWYTLYVTVFLWEFSISVLRRDEHAE